MNGKTHSLNNPVKGRSVPKLGLGVAAFVVTFVLSSLLALVSYAPDLNPELLWLDSYYLHITQFSFYQALLSSVFSVIPAIFVAIGFHRRHFIAKSLLIKLFSTTLVLPVLVGVLGIITIYGQSGWLNDLLGLLDMSLPFSIYGLNGILLAHIFFNLPYATRLFLLSLESIPVEQEKLALHLGLTPWHRFRLVEWPRIRQQLPHVVGLVFMLCFTSFATVMALGGGPQATTIELAIYQAIKYDFDLQAAALLSLWQILLCSSLSLTIQRFAKPIEVSTQTGGKRLVLFRDSAMARWWDRFWIALVIIVVTPPLCSVIFSGLNGKLISIVQDSEFWLAVFNSFRIAILASVIALFSGVAILSSSRIWRLRHENRKADLLDLSGTIILLTPGLVLSTGLFLLFRSFTDVFSLSYWIVVGVNALMGLPYVIKTLTQPMWLLAKQYQRLSTSLGIKGWSRWRLVEWRAMRRPMSYAFVISFLVALGDLSAIALFGTQDFQTLPLYLYRLLGSYQMEAAAAVAFIMLLICLLCFYLAERVFKDRTGESTC
ncbi:thiamine/thiamine pyrophosphate ABC transporter permease [Vibrio sp. WJH972]